MDFLTMHQRPVTIHHGGESKSIASRKATQSKERKKHDVLAKDRQLEKSLLSQYFVPQKKASNFPFLAQLHFLTLD